MEAKEYVQQLGKIKVKIRNYKDRLETLKYTATSISIPYGSERVQTSRNGSKIENSVTRYVDMEKKLQDAIVELIEKQGEILSTIEELPAAEYDFLHNRYFKELTHKEIAFLNGKTRSWAMYMCNKAMNHLQEILDERESIAG